MKSNNPRPVPHCPKCGAPAQPSRRIPGLVCRACKCVFACHEHYESPGAGRGDRTGARPEGDGIMDGLLTEVKRRGEALDEGEGDSTVRDLADEMSTRCAGTVWRNEARTFVGELLTEIDRLRAQVAAGGGTGLETAYPVSAWNGHAIGCSVCVNGRRCAEGDRLFRAAFGPAAEPEKGGGRP